MSDHFAEVPFEAPDSIFELKAAYDRDQSEKNINLGPGAYLDNEGKPWILPSMAEAERLIPPGHEYLPILGLPAFRSGARRIAFGDNSSLLSSNQIATIQAVSGTGAIRLAIQFLRQFHSPKATVYVSNPSWSNHRIMFEYAGFQVEDYPYYDSEKRSTAFEKMIDCMESAQPGSIFVLHACAHNPTGCDLSQAQRRKISEIMIRKKLMPLLDSAYQGFASGDLEADGWAIRHLFEESKIRGLL